MGTTALTGFSVEHLWPPDIVWPERSELPWTEGGAGVEDVFASLSSMSLPDAIDAFLYYMDGRKDPSGFELFARRVLGEIDMVRLRSILDTHEVGIAYISRMEAFYLNFDHDEIEGDDRLVLLQAEAVLNRLLKLKKRIGDRAPSEETCSELDIRSFRDVTSAMPDVLVRAGGWNVFSEPGTVHCRPGGEWDVRTRFANLCEMLSPITHLDYTYDCDAAEGVIVVRFSCAHAACMPLSVYEAKDDRWRILGQGERADLALEHSYRIALLLAAAGFASGLRITRCYVVGEDVLSGDQSFTLKFDRPEFMATFSPFAAVLTRTPLEELVCVHACEDHLCDNDLVPSFGEDRWLKPRTDDRELPAELRDLLLADTAGDLNVMEAEDDAAMIRFKRIQARMSTDPDGAMEELLDLISSLEGRCAVAELSSPVPLQSQFCENALGRILLPLLEDDKSVRFYRAPDALYIAQYELVLAYMQAGELDLALTEARKLLDVAVTSPRAHLLLIDVLMRLGNFEDVVEVCRHGLRVAFDADSIFLYLYRLAFASWKLGDTTLALACYSLVPKRSRASDAARSEMHELMRETGVTTVPKRDQVLDTLRAADIPLAPTDELFDHVCDAAVMLVDNGFFGAAAPCVGFLWYATGCDELGVFLRSLEGPNDRP